MARNRVIYQSEALFCGDIGTHKDLGSGNQLLRVQDISHGVELNRTDINEFGQLDAIERKLVDPPTVNLDFSYYIHGGHNESLLGFRSCVNRTSQTASELYPSLSNFMKNDTGKNYYISVVGEGDDNKHETAGAQDGVIGIGNGYLASYNVEASVGDIPSSSVSIEANNIQFQSSGKDIKNPAVDLKTGGLYDFNNNNPIAEFPQAAKTGETDTNHDVMCLRPGDVLIDFNDAGEPKPKGLSDGAYSAADAELALGGAHIETGSYQGCHVQNFTLDVPLARTALTRLGNVYPYSREIEVPLNVTLSVSAFMADMKDGSLNEILCGGDKKRNIRITMKAPCSEGVDAQNADVVMEWLIKGASLDSQNFSASIGDNKTVDLVFTSQQSGKNGTGSGMFMWFDDKATVTAGVTDVSVNPRGDVTTH
jgi:hypothetical protein